MQVPIPDDYTGEWICLQLEWPNSPQWIGILMGLITMVGRGRYWDANTGSILGVQALAEEIFTRNYPFTDCDGQTVTNGGQTVTGGGGLVYSDWIEGMITNVEFDCTTGILTFYSGMCCVKEIDLSCLGQGGTVIDDDPYDPPAEQQACGKASALVDMLWLVLDAGWDAQGSFPTQWVGIVEASVPGYDLSDNACWHLVQQSVDLDNDYSKSEVLTDDRKQQMKCLAVSLFDETTVGITQAQYDAFRGLASVVFEGEQRQWALTGIEAFGFGNCVKIAALGAPVTADCTCPDYDGLSEPTPTGYYMGVVKPSQNFNVPYDPAGAFPKNDWGWAYINEVATRRIYGCIATLTLVSGSMGIIKRANDPIDFMGSYDVFLSGSNSDSFGQPLKIAQMHMQEFSDLGLAALGYTRVEPLSGDGYSGPTTPPVEAGESVLMAFSLQQDGSNLGVVQMTDFRWMINTIDD